jgi:hypothetical protein
MSAEINSRGDDLAWIDAMTDDQCMEVFWLYVDPPEPFLARYPPQLLGAAMRRALREIAQASTTQAQHSVP